MRRNRRDYISSFFASPYWLPVKSKFFVLHKTPPGPSSLFLFPYHRKRALCYQTAGWLVVPGVSKSEMAEPPVTSLLSCGNSTHFVFAAQSLSAYKAQLFDKACSYRWLRRLKPSFTYAFIGTTHTDNQGFIIHCHLFLSLDEFCCEVVLYKSRQPAQHQTRFHVIIIELL